MFGKPTIATDRWPGKGRLDMLGRVVDGLCDQVAALGKSVDALAPCIHCNRPGYRDGMVLGQEVAYDVPALHSCMRDTYAHPECDRAHRGVTTCECCKGTGETHIYLEEGE